MEPESGRRKGNPLSGRVWRLMQGPACYAQTPLIGGAMLSPAFDRSWSSSDFRPSAKVSGENGALEEQKSPSELAYGVVFGARTLRL